MLDHYLDPSHADYVGDGLANNWFVIRYHSSLVGWADPMYHAIGSPEFASKCSEDPVCYRFESSQNSDAAYNTTFLPSLYIDGEASINTNAYKTDAEAMRSEETNVTLSLEGTTFDSLTAYIKLTASSDSDLSADDLRLFLAMTLDSIAYNGSNGETEHHDVFIGWANNHFGGDTLVLAKDDTIKNSYEWSLRADYPKNSYFPKNDSEMAQISWDKKNMAVVAFVQKKSTNEILQAAQILRKDTASSTNSAPTITAIADVTMNEDESATVSLSATDAEGDAITFSSSSTTKELTLSVSSETLIIEPKENWNGEADITVTASDGLASSSVVFKLTVTAVNDAPASFEIEAPPNNSVIKITDQTVGQSLKFSWKASSDIDSDTITYIWSGTDGLDSVKVDPVKNATSLTMTYRTIYKAVDWSSDSTLSGSWTIIATDGTDSTAAANGPFTLNVSENVQDVVGQQILPDRFALLQNYPNPFNSGTVISYRLPHSSDVEVEVLTILGQPVKALVAGGQRSGQHTVRWDGKDGGGKSVSGGIYLYRITAGQFTAVRKMIYLK